MWRVHSLAKLFVLNSKKKQTIGEFFEKFESVSRIPDKKQITAKNCKIVNRILIEILLPLQYEFVAQLSLILMRPMSNSSFNANFH